MATHILGIVCNKLALYFGVPRLLTFGFQIGPVMPASCDASLAIEGRNGLPCTLRRFLHWIAGDSGYRMQDIEWAWVQCAFQIGFILCLLLATVVFAWIMTGVRMKRPGSPEKKSDEEAHSLGDVDMSSEDWQMGKERAEQRFTLDSR